MPQYDLPLEELIDYRPGLDEPDDLDAFWTETLSESRALRRPTRSEAVSTGLRLVETRDLEFSGFGGQRIRAWLHVPRAEAPAGGFGVVVEYVGAGAGRGLPHEPSLWALAGHAHLVMDNRGQGAGWRVGDTPDILDEDAGAPSFPGFATRGIRHPRSSYYRRLYTDAVLAVDVAREQPGIDPARVVVDGVSQGGGVALAVAGLVAGLQGVMAEVPFLCDFPRGVAIAGPPYSEIAGYLAVHRDRVAEAFRTLSYFDAAILGRRATAPALFAAALMDLTTPPSTVFAAHNHYGAPAEIAVYPYNGHEGGGSHHSRRRLAFAAEHLGVANPADR